VGFKEKVVLLASLHNKLKEKKGNINSGYVTYWIQDRNVACSRCPYRPNKWRK